MKTGIDVRISDTAIISRPDLLEIGNHVCIDVGCYISVGAKIGDYIHIGPYVCITGGEMARLIMEDFTGISAGSKLIVKGEDFTKGLVNPTVPVEYRYIIGGEIIMRKFSVVGVNSVVMPGIEMAEGSVLGANSLLTENTKAWAIYSGSPAKVCGFRDKKMILDAAKEMGYE
jgi:acetyltransferase-like isoleucine patch superfamily enzyme